MTATKLPDDELSVMGGAHFPPPMPTEADYRRAHKQEYVRLMGELGVDEETAGAWHDHAWELIKDRTPQQAVDDETDYWTGD